METARDRALVHLYGQREVGGPRPAAVAALRAAGLLSEEEAAGWSRAPAPEAPLGADAGMRAAAAELLEELLAQVPPEDRDEGLGAEENRFEGALAALSELGAASPAEWDARLRARLRRVSWEEEEAEMRAMNSGGTERELLAVLPGPSEAVDGVRLLYALRFADGVGIVFRRPLDDDDSWEWEMELRDDLGTYYSEAGGSGGGEENRVSFRTAVPADARWIELVGVASEPLRVWL
jgi:hypothetical protein